MWTGLATIVLAVFIGVAVLITQAPFLRVSFAVEGGPPGSADRLLASITAAAVSRSPVLAALGPDHRFLWQAANEFRETLLVGNAMVELSPSILLGTALVTVTATTRDLAGVWCGRTAGECYGFDDTGTLRMRVPETAGSLILTVTALGDSPRVLGQRIVPDPAWIKRLHRVLEAVAASGERVARVGIREEELHEWELTLGSGPTLLLSFDFVPDDLASTLRALRGKVPFSNLQTIDLRVPGRLYYR